ncbi:hypothetical protein XMKAXML_00072 [Enterococcus phage vB_OCPT_PG13]|nr:hypothetical protein [Enterococcus phage vB_OCPT_SDS1]UQT01311.1 hypothetical protein EMSIMAW_00028 [Enterococcus phage vB_OCPT_PG2]UQT01398.1 hypothetical protein WMKKAML_00021 [Enterococcus phage vB_OCPT_PG9]UQT01637.1 hypothetical protein XMKAXML_00072 [Enterococcus phage vB_OCPT_PG13]
MNLFKSMLWAFITITIMLVFVFLVELLVAYLSGIWVFVIVLAILFIILTLAFYSESIL